VARAEVTAASLVEDLKKQVVEQRIRVDAMREAESHQQIIWGDTYRDKAIRDELVTYAGLVKQLHSMLIVGEESDAKIKALEEGIGIDITVEAEEAFEQLIFDGKITAESLEVGSESTSVEPDGEEGVSG